MPDSPLEPTALMALAIELRRLNAEAGRPSSRTLAAKAGCSHTAIADALRGQSLSRWPIVEKVTMALSGDVDAMRALWIKAAMDAPRYSRAAMGVHEFCCPHCGTTTKVRIVALESG